MDANKDVRMMRKAVAVTAPPPRRRVIAVGKRVNGRWQVRTSLWRYLAATALSLH